MLEKALNISPAFPSKAINSTSHFLTFPFCSLNWMRMGIEEFSKPITTFCLNSSLLDLFHWFRKVPLHEDAHCLMFQFIVT